MQDNGGNDKWQIGSEKKILKTRVGDIVSAKVRCVRTGEESEFYRLSLPDWVNIIALTPNKEVILIKQFRFGSKKTELEIPGGTIEKGENPVLAGERELLEETGYAGKNGRVIGKVCPNPAIQGNWCYTILVEDAEKVAEQRMDDMEDIEVVAFPVSEIMELVSTFKIEHGLVLNGLFFLSLALNK